MTRAQLEYRLAAARLYIELIALLVLLLSALLFTGEELFVVFEDDDELALESETVRLDAAYEFARVTFDAVYGVVRYVRA